MQTFVTEGLKENRLIASKQEGQGRLGSLIWYSISRQLITPGDLKRMFDEVQMDHHWLPNNIRPSDAFRRATGDIQKRQRKVPTSDPTVFLNFLIREVYSDHKKVQRNVVIEQVNKKGRTLNYDPTATIIEFNKEDCSISIHTEEKANEGEQMAKELALSAKDLYGTYARHYEAQTLRSMVKNIIDSMTPTAVRPAGGVYFVPKHHQIMLDKMVDLVNRLENSEAFAVPLFDTKSNRGMVNSKLRDDVLAAIAKCRSVIGYPDPKKPQITDTLHEARRVMKTFREYQSIVNLDLEVLSDSLTKLKHLSIEVMQKAN